MADEQRQINLETEHDHFSGQKAKYALWRDVYEGGDRVEGKRSYLPQHNLETNRQYDLRLKRARYRNYAKPIVGVFHSYVWRRPPHRVLPPDLEILVPNVDLQGLPADDFFGKVTLDALVEGVSFVAVDVPSLNAESIDRLRLSKADMRRLNIRPYMVQIPALSLMDWGIDDAGNLQYAVIKKSVEITSAPFRGHVYQDQWHLWTRDGYQVWTKDSNNFPMLLEEGRNDLGAVPIVPFYYERRWNMVGRSVLADAAGLCLKVYQKDSEKDTAEFYTSIPIWFFRGFTREEMEDIALASSNGIIGSRSTSEIQILESRGTAIESLRRTIADTEEAIFEIMLRQVKPQTRVAESYEKRKLDQVQMEAQIEKWARASAQAERKCWELAARWMDLDPTDIEVEYNTDYDTERMAAELIGVLLQLRQNRDISRDTLWSLLKEGEVLGADFDPEDEKARIEQEERESLPGGGEGSTAAALAARFGVARGGE